MTPAPRRGARPAAPHITPEMSHSSCNCDESFQHFIEPVQCHQIKILPLQLMSRPPCLVMISAGGCSWPLQPLQPLHSPHPSMTGSLPTPDQYTPTPQTFILHPFPSELNMHNLQLLHSTSHHAFSVSRVTPVMSPNDSISTLLSPASETDSQCSAMGIFKVHHHLW